MTKRLVNKYNNIQMAVEYEFVFLTPAEVEEEVLKKTLSGLEKEIKQINGKINDKEKIGRKALAYQIKGEDQAVFLVWHLQFPEDTKIESFNTYLNRNDTIIRYLFLKKD